MELEFFILKPFAITFEFIEEKATYSRKEQFVRHPSGYKQKEFNPLD